MVRYPDQPASAVAWAVLARHHDAKTGGRVGHEVFNRPADGKIVVVVFSVKKGEEGGGEGEREEKGGKGKREKRGAGRGGGGPANQ